jgi:chromosome partitioning protein
MNLEGNKNEKNFYYSRCITKYFNFYLALCNTILYIMYMIITISNQKGGVGKTTTALALAAGLTAMRKRTLLVDLDSQMNSTVAVGANDSAATVYDILTDKATATEAIQKTPVATIIAGNRNLAEMDIRLANKTGREYRLKKALSSITGKWDYIVIDSPPALGTLTVNALTAADGVVIPACPEAFGLQGISQLYVTIADVIEYSNKKLWVMGILLTRCRELRLMKQLDELAVEAAVSMNTTLYKTRVRESKDIKEAQALQQTILEYAPASIGAEDYKNFVTEFTSQIKKGRKK